MNLFQKVWAVLTQGSLRKKLEARWIALSVATVHAQEARKHWSEWLKQPNQSSRVREINKLIQQYTTEQLQIEALLRDMK